VTFDFFPLDIIMVFDVGWDGSRSERYVPIVPNPLDSYEFSWAVLVIRKTMLCWAFTASNEWA
jgi:hypothetical protein